MAQVLRAGKGASPDVQVAEWVGYAQPVEFAKIVYAIGQLYGKCEIAVEIRARRRHHGQLSRERS